MFYNLGLSTSRRLEVLPVTVDCVWRKLAKLLTALRLLSFAQKPPQGNPNTALHGAL